MSFKIRWIDRAAGSADRCNGAGPTMWGISEQPFVGPTHVSTHLSVFNVAAHPRDPYDPVNIKSSLMGWGAGRRPAPYMGLVRAQNDVLIGRPDLTHVAVGSGKRAGLNFRAHW